MKSAYWHRRLPGVSRRIGEGRLDRKPDPLTVLEAFSNLTRAPTPEERQQGYEALQRAGYFEERK